MGMTRRFRSGDRVVVIVESGRRDGPVFVLVHGLGMAHEYWDGLADALEPGGRVLAVDLPGFGDAPDPDEPLSMPESGALLAELIEAERLDRPVLVGHSTGAQVVAETAAQRPDLVGPVVLIGPTVDPRERTVPKQAARFLQDVAIGNPKVVAIGLRSYLEGGIVWYFRNLRPMIEHRMERTAPRIEAPVLVVRAEHDRIVARDWGRELARLARGRYAEVPGRGHETMVTAGPQVADLIARHAAGEPVGEVVGEASALPAHRTSHSDDQPALAWWRRALIWCADYAYAGWRQLAVLTAWRPPRRWLRGEDALPDVVLVPGVYEHWTFLRPLGDRLNRAGYRVRTVHGMGVNRRPILPTADRLARALARRPAPPAGRVIVGHSKGGLIGKQVLVTAEAATGDRRSSSDEGAHRVQVAHLGLLGVVAIATPFSGTRLARYLADPSVRAFLPDDPVIVSLGRSSSVNARVVSIAGPFDPHIPDGSLVDGATNVVVPTPGHFRILGAPETAEAVIEGLELLANGGVPADASGGGAPIGTPPPLG
ncbi:alpha/beta fold hydrolase [Agromyces sp. CFH 90414]|uniref:Alpha/beta fold hydrolase n=1 Tax=Agromyces agglutinans TaxID=2662258 RepID=A0A6I2F6B3_9MICO|nr:alpha/beta hydrolase [Agromyces agglutinans]MRG59841.1 alpha/beta fold hydrolase [Agromyces agglutinans]